MRIFSQQNCPVFCAAALVCGAADGFAESVSDEVDFFRDIQPVFSEHCTGCHGGVKRKGGISFTHREDAFVEAESGSIPLVPGDLASSQLILRITAEDEDDRMPPEHPLAPDEIALLKKWVAAGADWPEHWAFQPVSAGDLPAVRDASWPRNTIDRHVLARLEREGIRPSPEADRRTLIRRLALDLTGLLPTPREVHQFLSDQSESAYETVVDSYLASPHFGERWGRHWLDEARYADSAGYEKDSPRADAYRWRDWVIDAINRDMPFDEFTIKQIAGDLLPSASDTDRLATAFHLMTQFNLEGGVDAEEDRTKRVIDRVNTVGSVWLGATIGCAQCHDHPYDPFSQREFYGLYAFFNNADFEARFIGDVPADADKRIEERNKQWEPLAQFLEEIVTNNDLSVTVQSRLTKLRQFDNENGFTRVLAEREANRRKTYVFHRGDFLQPSVEDGELAPGVPGVWPPLAPRATEEPDRLDLARWLVSPENPLTARVTVNRVWARLFGEPLAPISQDFGTRGTAPAHPELLDWLAHHFMHEAGWSRKKLIKEIAMSAAYRQTSAHRPELAEIDPDNKLLARQNRFRVEAEIIRDIQLQAGGLLATDVVGGPSVFPPIPEDVAEQSYANNFKWKTSAGNDRYRRGLYTFFKRTAPDPNLMTFDCPDASISNQLRDVSNSPIQALALLQNEVFVEAAQSLAKTLVNQALRDDESRIRSAFVTALGRNPAPGEKTALLRLLDEARRFYAGHPDDAAALIGAYAAHDAPAEEVASWVATARIILNLDEFITRS